MSTDLTVTSAGGHVAVVEIHRPPENFFDAALIGGLADALERLQDDGDTRAVVLCSEGKHFCAGADFSNRAPAGPQPELHLYDQAVRMFSARLPIVAAVQGAAIGGGLGLALAADFRIGAPEARMAANFARLGFHHGFGLTVTLPAVVGQQRALELLYTGRRVDGNEAHEMGLLDRLVPVEQVRAEAIGFAGEIARSGPLAVASIRVTMRGHLPAAIRAATDRERAEQDRLRTTADFAEGIKAYAQRREPDFQGR